MTENPVERLLSQLNRFVASTEALVADNAALKAEILESNTKTVQKITAQITAIEMTFKRAECDVISRVSNCFRGRNYQCRTSFIKPAVPSAVA